jgi:hypothetical protein
MRRVLWIVGLVLLGALAAVVVIMSKPSSDPPPPATTPAEPPGEGELRTFNTDAFKLTLSGDWENPCLEQAKCENARMGKNQRRSAFVKGTDPTAVSLTIDRTRVNARADLSLNEIIDAAEQPLFATVSGYDRAEGMPRRITLPPDIEARELSFTSREAKRPAGTVFAFKHRNDVYVINARGPDPGTARDEAIRAVDGLEPR